MEVLRAKIKANEPMLQKLRVTMQRIGFKRTHDIESMGIMPQKPPKSKRYIQRNAFKGKKVEPGVIASNCCNVYE
jgi:hypothetical protein